MSEPKPLKRVRCYYVAVAGSWAFWAYHPDEMNERVPDGATVTPGWFVPDTESSDAR